MAAAATWEVFLGGTYKPYDQAVQRALEAAYDLGNAKADVTVRGTVYEVTLQGGRRLAQKFCVEHPSLQEIMDVLGHLGFEYQIEDKIYPRNITQRGRIRVKLFEPGTKEPVALPASAEGAEIVYIVRIKGAPEIDTIARNFKRNPDVAQEAYAELCERLPALKEFQLVGASYSGEVKLAYQLAPGVQPTRAVMNDIKDKIMAIEGVAYADPDFVAHPGEDRK